MARTADPATRGGRRRRSRLWLCLVQPSLLRLCGGRSVNRSLGSLSHSTFQKLLKNKQNKQQKKLLTKQLARSSLH